MVEAVADTVAGSRLSAAAIGPSVDVDAHRITAATAGPAAAATSTAPDGTSKG